jgi:hypothetical protein
MRLKSEDRTEGGQGSPSEVGRSTGPRRCSTSHHLTCQTGTNLDIVFCAAGIRANMDTSVAIGLDGGEEDQLFEITLIMLFVMIRSDYGKRLWVQAPGNPNWIAVET